MTNKDFSLLSVLVGESAQALTTLDSTIRYQDASEPYSASVVARAREILSRRRNELIKLLAEAANDNKT